MKNNWIKEVLRIAENLRKAHEAEIVAFNTFAEKNGLQSAIGYGERVIRREEQWMQVMGIDNYLRTSEATDKEKAASILETIAERRKSLYGMRCATSTSALSNAMENIRLDVRLGMFSNFGGELATIETYINMDIRESND